MQFSLSEITCVVCCSEPSKPRIAIHTPKLTKGSSPCKLQFSGDTDMEDWMANLTSGKKLLNTNKSTWGVVAILVTVTTSSSKNLKQ